MGGARNDEVLGSLGWGPDFAQALESVEAAGEARPGRVSRIDRGGWLTVESAEGSERARQHTRFRRIADPLAVPAVGDWVLLRPDPGGGPPIADDVLPRRTLFVRNAGDDERVQPQALAANIDSVLIVSSLDVPYNARRMDRFLALAWASGAQPVVVLTKADVRDDLDDAVAEVRAHVREADLVAISSRAGTGLEDLGRHLEAGRTVVLIGQSGAGKSTLANRLMGDEALTSAEVRKDGKGRHTTSHRQLLQLPSGALLIDTPGLRSVGLWETQETLDEGAFTDIEELATQCRFSDCAHEEEPGCAVRAALEDGTLSADRWASYRTLRAEADQITHARMLAERASKTGRRRR